ncbi:hypothetical protein P0F65_05045 [Sphingomonas sp. I4]
MEDTTTKQVEAFLRKDALWMAFVLAMGGQLRQYPLKTLITAISGSAVLSKVAAHYLGL